MCVCLADMGKGQECISIFVFQNNASFVPCLVQISEMVCRKKKWKTQMLMKMVKTVIKHLSAGQHFAFGGWGEQG